MALRPMPAFVAPRLLAAVAAAWMVASPDAAADLPSDVARRVEAAISDLTRGRAADAHQTLQPLLELGSPAQQREIEVILRRYRLEDPLGPLVANLRIEATVAAGARPGKTLKPMGAVEAGFVAAAVEGRLQSLLGPIDQELDVGFRVDAATEALEEQLARCTSLLDQMDAVERLQALQGEAGKLARAKGKTSPKKEAAQHKGRRDQLVSRIVEIALAVIPDQLQVLRDDGAPYASRAKAAARLEDAFAVAKLHYPKYRGVKKATGKSIGGKTVGQQEGALKEQEREFDKLAGPLRLKIYHFEQGKQWWLRGRFGVGPYHDGLTKAAVGRNTFEAFLFYPLLMPDPIPKPVAPLKDARPLPVARRHLEVWKAAFPAGQAYARAERNLRISNQTWKLSVAPPGQPALNYARIVDNDDDFNPFVGYLEYQMALYHWGRLLALAGEAELKGLEKSMAEDDRFVVPSYLSRQYDAVDPNSTLRLSPPKSDDPRVTDVYERRGLSWCIALAQVEVAGVRAVYTGLEYEPKAVGDPLNTTGIPQTLDARNRLPPVAAVPVRRPRPVRPFDRVTPTPFTQRALADLLWDGMRQQYYRIRTEVLLDQTRESLPNEFLPPVVRLAVALEFVRAYRLRFAGTLTAAQLRELQVWQSDLEGRLGRIVGAWSNALRLTVNQMNQTNLDLAPLRPRWGQQFPTRPAPNPSNQPQDQAQNKSNDQAKQGGAGKPPDPPKKP